MEFDNRGSSRVKSIVEITVREEQNVPINKDYADSRIKILKSDSTSKNYYGSYSRLEQQSLDRCNG